jgi:TolB-like protein
VVAAVWWASERQLFTAPSPSSRASVAVLPFASFAADSAGTSSDYFSDGLTEDIISALGRFRDLSVISRGGVFAYKGKNPTPAEVGRDLKVRYVVEGSVRRTPDHIRVAVSLTDTVRGTVLWSDKYDVDAKDIFSVQDRTTRISGMLAVKVTSLELARSAVKPPGSVEAYDLVLQGRDLLSRHTRSNNAQARTLFERAIMLDSGYAPAYVGLGRVNFYAVAQGWTFDARATFERAERLVRRAIELDDASSSAHALLGLILLYLGNNYDGALVEISRKSRRQLRIRVSAAQFPHSWRACPGSDGLIQRYGSFAGSKNSVGGARSQREPVSPVIPCYLWKNRENSGN